MKICFVGSSNMNYGKYKWYIVITTLADSPCCQQLQIGCSVSPFPFQSPLTMGVVDCCHHRIWLLLFISDYNGSMKCVWIIPSICRPSIDPRRKVWFTQPPLWHHTAENWKQISKTLFQIALSFIVNCNLNVGVK